MSAATTVADLVDAVRCGDLDLSSLGASMHDRAVELYPVPRSLTGPGVRETLTDNVQLPKVIMAWHSPAHYTEGDADLDLLAAILEEGKASRLYKALVYDKPLAQEILGQRVTNLSRSHSGWHSMEIAKR